MQARATAAPQQARVVTVVVRAADSAGCLLLTAPAGARQFLEAYKSVTLESMAQAFGVSPAFMDAELAEFIVAGRVSAKIDKARGPPRRRPACLLCGCLQRLTTRVLPAPAPCMVAVTARSL